MIIVLCLTAVTVRAEDIRLLTYHLAPPFVVDQDSQVGLSYELAAQLSSQSAGRYRFHVVPLDRADLDADLKATEGAVVPWVNPAWFPAAASDAVAWTDGYLEDGNAMISLASAPFEYAGPTSLAGRSVSGPAGHRWVGIDAQVKVKAVRRLDTKTFWEALRNVLQGQADVAVVPYSIARYYIAKHSKAGAFHFSATPHSRFERKFMVDGNPGVFAYLQDLAASLRHSVHWTATMARFGM